MVRSLESKSAQCWYCTNKTDLIVVAVIILVIVLPIIYVAIPNKAQHDINASTLEVTSQEVTNTEPDQVHVKIKAIARSSSSFHPTLEGFQAGLSLPGHEPFLYLNIPETKAEAETNINIDQDAPIVNMDSFKEYTKTAIASENFTVLMSGKTKVHQKGLSAISVDYDKHVQLKGEQLVAFVLVEARSLITTGLNKLSGLSIEDIKILSGSKNVLPDGSNLIGNVIIPNPSVMTLDLGNVTMNLSIDDKAIGIAVLTNLVLKPGTNNSTLTSKVEQLDVIEFITKKYKDGVVPLDIIGNSSVRNGQHLEYFEEAIKSNTIKIKLALGPALQAIGLNITSSS